MVDLHRNIAPPLQLIDQVNFQKPVEQRLDNGMMAYLMKGGSHEIVRFELLFKAGSFDQEKPLQAYATAHLLTSGTYSKKAEEINKLWDFYGVSLQIEAQKDIISVGFFCLTRHLDPVLDLLMEIISDAIFPEDELDSLLQNKKQNHLVNRKKVQHQARVHFNELLFGSLHPYGTKIKPEDFEQLLKEDLTQYRKLYIHPANCICFVSGHFPDNISHIINQKLEKIHWPHNEGRANGQGIKPKGVAGKHFVKMEDAMQSSIRIGKMMIGRNHPDYHKTSVTNTLLGGYFGSRLMRNIRQEKGYTYGINSALVALMRETYFFITTQVGNDVKDLALKEVYSELRCLRERPADKSELLMLKNYLSASFLRSFDGPFMQMERFREILLFDLDYSHYECFLPTLNDIRASDLQEMAEKYFHEKDMLELVVG